MVEGEYSIRRKKSKAAGKKLSPKMSVSARVAAKKRRNARYRRISEGMCLSLPTPHDPFRDRYRGKKDTDIVDDDVLFAEAKSYFEEILRDGDVAENDHLEQTKKVVKVDNNVDKKSLIEEGRVKRVGNIELVNTNGWQKKAKSSSIEGASFVFEHCTKCVAE